MAHHHSHEHPQATRLLGRAFILIAAFMVVELLAGLWTNALVLIADAGHMFLDAAALGLAWWAARISQRESDHKLSYGYHRFGVLAAFVNGLTLMALVIWITIEAAGRVAQPEAMLPLPTLAVAVTGFVVNLIAYYWLHGNTVDSNVRSATLHVLGDLLGSAAAIIAALAVYFFDWWYADPVLALLIVVILSRGAYRVIKESAHILLEGVPEGVDLAEIKRVLTAQVAQVKEIHHVHAWALTETKPLLTLHARVNRTNDVHGVVADIKRVLSSEFGIDHSTIQVELGECPDSH